MCFYIHEKFPKPLIAKKDIVCWKVGEVKAGLFAPEWHLNFFYREGKRKRKVRLEVERAEISRGYHSYTTRAHAEILSMAQDVGKFIIPKGATYYKNPDEKEYVSNTIIYTGKAR